MMTTTLAIVIKNTHTKAGSHISNSQMPIEQRQVINILNYILIHTNEYEVKVDARLIKYEDNIKARKVANKSADREKNITFLKELLKGADWDIDIEHLQKEKNKEEIDQIEDKKEILETKKLIKKKFMVSKIPYQITLNEIPYIITIVPINTLPNINTISEVVLRDYLSYKGVAYKLAQLSAASIKDWVDKDDFVRINGAERAYYGALYPQSYNPKNTKIESWQELSYIKSLNPQVISIIRKNFIFSGKSTQLYKMVLDNKELAILAGLTDKEFSDAEEYLLDNNKVDVLAPEYVLKYKKTITNKRGAEKYIIIDIHGVFISLRAVYDIQDEKLMSFFYYTMGSAEREILAQKTQKQETQTNN